MWQYEQSTGKLSHDGALVGTGYSGHAEGVNNPAYQNVSMIGPVPCGIYTIGPAFTHPKCGPIAMRLLPAPETETFGRSGFLCHGDNCEHNESASEGCVIMPRDVRLALSASTDRQLQVLSYVL